jgi:hypothetical protein
MSTSFLLVKTLTTSTAISGSCCFQRVAIPLPPHSIANLPLPARLDWHPIGRPAGMMAEEWVAKE